MSEPYPIRLATLMPYGVVSLRRYRSDAPDGDARQTSVPTGAIVTMAPDAWMGDGRTTIDPTDSRWPAHAADGYVFTPEDGRVVDTDRLMRLADGREVTMDDAPVGTCYVMPRDWTFADHRRSAQYLSGGAQTRGMYMLKLPNGDWFSPDWYFGGRADGNPQRIGWAVTGEPEAMVVTPSVNILGTGGWHGWIGIESAPPGHLSRDLHGRPL